MPPKKKGKKKNGKKKKKKEPKHDSGWKKTIGNGKWERPLESLPSVDKWPTWGEIRENMFAAFKKLVIIWSENLDDRFIDELFFVPRLLLEHLDLRGSKLLTKFVLSPPALALSIKYIDISCCQYLGIVMIQSHSLEKLVLSRSFLLKKVLLETKTLKELVLNTCPALETLMVWSDVMSHLNIMECKDLTNLELYCPKLENLEKGPLKVVIPPRKPRPPIFWILKQEALRAPIPPLEFGYPDADKPGGLQSTRPIVPRTHLFGV